MGESTLSLGYADLMNAICEHLGFGVDYTAKSAAEQAMLDRCVQSGCRRFYFPPSGYAWTFLRPTTSIQVFGDATGTIVGAPAYDAGTGLSTITATAAKFYALQVGKSFVFDTSGNSYTIAAYISTTVIKVTGDASAETAGDTFTLNCDYKYDLPDDFGTLFGAVTHAGDDRPYDVIELTGEGRIRYHHGINDTTGRPEELAVRPKSTTGAAGQRFEIIVWPKPDAAYTLLYKYRVLPNKLSASYPYPYGGMHHAETIRAACLAASEELQDDAQGIHKQAFMERLEASIKLDLDMVPQHLGYNGDNSDNAGVFSRRTEGDIYINGVKVS